MNRPIRPARTIVVWIVIFLTCGIVSQPNPAEASSVLIDKYPIGFVGTCDTLKQTLQQTGYPVSEVTYDDFVNGSVSVKKYSCLVFAQSERFPYTGSDCLLRYLKDGGDIITLGGYAFQIPVYPYKDGWYSQDELLRTLRTDSPANYPADADISHGSQDSDGTAQLKLPEGFGKPLFEKVLPIFSHEVYHRFKKAARICVCPGQSFADSQADLISSLDGVSAIGYPYVDQSRYYGILDARDKFGRRIGFAAGVLVHYNGPFKDGRWLIFGIENTSFYSTAFFTQSVTQSLEKMRDRSLSGQLVDAAAQARKKFMPRPKSALAPIRRSSDGKHFVDANGKRFFILGVNYIGSFDCKTSHARENFIYEKWETDFRKAHEAGINCMRLWMEGLDGNKEKMDSILYLADRYGIYLLLMPAAHPKETDRESAKQFSTLAQLVNGEPAVIGYDLMNEPYITTVGSVRINGKASDIIRHDPYTRYAEKKFFDKEWVDTMARNRSGWPEISGWSQDEEAKSLLAAYDIFSRYSGRYIASKDYSCLYGIDGPLPIEPDYAEYFASMDRTLASWIDLHLKPIRRHNPSGLVTAGYNTALTALAANKELDFVSHHLYQPPTSYEDMKKAVTTFDRLRAVWPDKPITLGEFGYSCGAKLPDGGTLDIYNSAVGEMGIYLYAFANDFDGAMSWMVSDWPVAEMDYSAPWIDKSRQRYEAGFGMYAYDGTQTGRPKPVVHAMKCFREYLDTSPAKLGSFQLIEADTQTGAGYIFQNDKALFVGAKSYADENIRLDASNAANLMLYWTDDKLRILSTADATLSLEREFLDEILGQGEVWIDGLKKSFHCGQDGLKIKLFEGQKCVITLKTTTEITER